IQSRAPGPASAEVAAAVHNLAQACEKRGQYAEAERLFRRALGIYEATVGEEHDLTARAYNNLAYLEDDRHDHAAAEPLHRRALAIRERVHGPVARDWISIAR
ncbi:MAG: tetratricopeptide repeat protein, partial [Planctomycetia bacterium]